MRSYPRADPHPCGHRCCGHSRPVGPTANTTLTAADVVQVAKIPPGYAVASVSIDTDAVTNVVVNAGLNADATTQTIAAASHSAQALGTAGVFAENAVPAAVLKSWTLSASSCWSSTGGTINAGQGVGITLTVPRNPLDGMCHESQDNRSIADPSQGAARWWSLAPRPASHARYHFKPRSC